MPVGPAYFAIIFIWSTTALGIRWSVDGVGFLFGIASRMSIALALTLVLCRLLRVSIPHDKRALETYFAAGVLQYCSMMLTYWGAQYVPSGLIAVLYGTGPIWTGLFASWWLAERFSRQKLLGLIMGLVGLAVINRSSLLVGPQAALAVGGVLLGALVQALSTVWVKRIGGAHDPFAITAGSLTLALPLYLVSWWLFGGGVPADVPVRTMAAIAYMSTVASVAGFSLFFYLLRHLPASRVALIQLITPVTALLLGHAFNREAIDPAVWLGTMLILLGLGINQYESLRRSIQR